MSEYDAIDQRDLQQQQQHDREQIEQEMKEAIRHAEKLGLPAQEVQLLRWGCGI